MQIFSSKMETDNNKFIVSKVAFATETLMAP